MSDYRDIWDEAYDKWIANGLCEEEARYRADLDIQEWSERQMARAEAVEDR